MKILKFFQDVDKLIRLTISSASPDEQAALFIYGFVPGKCPFEKDIVLLGKKIHIPALCTLNPYYPEIVALRIRAVEALLTEFGYTLMNGNLVKGNE